MSTTDSSVLSSGDDDEFRRLFLRGMFDACRTDRRMDAEVSRMLGLPSVYGAPKPKDEPWNGVVPDSLPEGW